MHTILTATFSLQALHSQSPAIPRFHILSEQAKTRHIFLDIPPTVLAWVFPLSSSIALRHHRLLDPLSIIFTFDMLNHPNLPFLKTTLTGYTPNNYGRPPAMPAAGNSVLLLSFISFLPPNL